MSGAGAGGEGAPGGDATPSLRGALGDEAIQTWDCCRNKNWIAASG